MAPGDVYKRQDMKRWLAKLTNNNAQGEYYITDIIALAYQEGREIVAVHPQRLSEVEGVNNRLQLSRLERVYQSEPVSYTHLDVYKRQDRDCLAFHSLSCVLKLISRCWIALVNACVSFVRCNMSLNWRILSQYRAG